MNTDLPPDVQMTRLNPFVFPSDTSFRFALLLVAVLGSSSFMYHAIWHSVGTNSQRYHQAVMESFITMANNPRTFEAKGAALEQHLGPLERSIALWVFGGQVSLLAMAWVFYWLWPRWKIRHNGLVSLTPQDLPEEVMYLNQLCREAVVARPPEWLYNPYNTRLQEYTFGWRGQYYVVLTGGLLSQFNTDRPKFRALVLHELAHIRNRDVSKTYFTIALCCAFVFAALLPCAVVLVFEPLDFSLGTAWRVLALTGLVYLTGMSILRVRELYADVRASKWDGPGGALTRALKSLPFPKCGGRLLGKLEDWIPCKVDRYLKPLYDHPDPIERMNAVYDPRVLLRASFWDAAATGVAVTIAFQGVQILLSALLFSTRLVTMSFTLAALIFTPLAAGLIGVRAWQHSLVARVEGGNSPYGLSPLVLGLVLGTCVGLKLSFFAVVSGELSPSTSLSPVTFLVFQVLWIALLLICFIFISRWMLAVARTWLSVNAGRSVTRAAFAASVVVAGSLLAVWLASLFELEEQISYLRDLPRADAERVLQVSGAFTELFNMSPLPRTYEAALISAVALGVLSWPLRVITQPSTLPALLSLWALPLAAWFWRDRSASTTVPDWALLDASAPERRASVERLPPFQLRTSVMAGVIGSFMFFLLAIALRLWVRGTFSEEMRGTIQARIMVYYGVIILAAVMQAGVAAYVAARVQRLRVLLGVFSAFIAGCLMTAVMNAVNLMFGGSVGSLVWLEFTLIVNSGGLLALIVASVMALITRWIRGGHYGSMPISAS